MQWKKDFDPYKLGVFKQMRDDQMNNLESSLQGTVDKILGQG